MSRIALLALFFPLLGSAAPGQNSVLWREWYLYTVAGVPQGYFEEVMERRSRDKHLAVTQRWVEAEGGRTETYIGSVATDDGKLTPVAFFSERKGAKVYKIDGRAKSGKLDMTFKPLKPKGENRKKSVPLQAGLHLSNFVPLLLSSHDPAKGTLTFQAVVEDAKDGNFDSRSGTAEIFGATKTIKGNTCRKAVVEFDGVEGEWWVTKEGKLCDLQIPASQGRLQLTTEAEAKKSLGK